MTTYTTFQPSPTGAVSFQATLDGAIYTITVTWNLFGQRYYVNCYDLSQDLIFALPLVGSGTGFVLSSLACDDQGNVDAVSATPLSWNVGQTVRLTVSGTTPSGYSGTYPCLITGASSFTYVIPTGGLANAQAPGNASFDVNLAGGYFTTSTLVYRTADQRFEVSP